MSRRPYDADDLYEIDQEISTFADEHGSNLNNDEREELRDLLNERAAAISDVLGVEVHSICEDDD